MSSAPPADPGAPDNTLSRPHPAHARRQIHTMQLWAIGVTGCAVPVVDRLTPHVGSGTTVNARAVRNVLEVHYFSCPVFHYFSRPV